MSSANSRFVSFERATADVEFVRASIVERYVHQLQQIVQLLDELGRLHWHGVP